ncbi:MAG: TetR/AcrR family transcriptional regulator [Eubacteriales bacterium]|nr:TetR/AcrR family transcriptional regulator [Eubacteriales bacterium]
MPKTFSEQEKVYIRERLLEEAKKSLAQYGIRKTTVDELVRRVGIPKGTFYLFYESKERLLFDVILQFNDEIQTELLAEISALASVPDAELLTDIIFRLYCRLDDSFLPRVLQDGEMEFFMRTLPPELAKLHAEHDDNRVRDLLKLLPGMHEDRAEVFSAALRCVFLTLMHKSEIGEAIFDETLRILIRGIVIQLLEEC